MRKMLLAWFIIVSTCFSLFASVEKSDSSSNFIKKFDLVTRQRGCPGIINGNRDGRRGPPGPPGPIGPQGPAGPAGPAAFIADTGQTLIFNFSLNVVAGLLGTTTITPFVEGPNGITYYTPTRTSTFAPLVIGLLPFQSITVPNPLFGNYQAGVLVTNTLGLAGIDASLFIAATQSRDGTSTFLFPVTLATTVPPLIGVTRIQVSEPYSYYVSP